MYRLESKVYVNTLLHIQYIILLVKKKKKENMNLASFSHFFTFYLSRAFSILLTYLSIYLAKRKIIYLLFDSHKSEIEIETRDKKKKKKNSLQE